MIAPMHNKRYYHGVATLGGKLYAVGGAVALGSANAATASGEVYDPIDNSWNMIRSMNHERVGLGLAALGDKLYAVGGTPATTIGGTDPSSALSSVEVYDPIDNSWNFVTPMNIPRAYHATAVVGGKLYAVGGVADISFADGLTSAEVYDPIDNSWNMIASMDISLCMAGAAALGGKLYVVGGISGNVWDHGSNLAITYDPMNPSRGWSSIGSTPGQAALALHELVALGGKLYAVGGATWTGGGADKQVWAYDPSLVQLPQITYQGEDFYISHQRGGPKTFVIPHPEHEGKMLRHACLEAPTRGTNIYEYRIEVEEDDVITSIALPTYFKHLNNRPRVYITATNVMSGYYGYVDAEKKAILVYTEKAGIFDIKVTGIRCDKAAVLFSSSEYIDEPVTP